jgi:hypothetical protein
MLLESMYASVSALIAPFSRQATLRGAVSAVFGFSYFFSYSRLSPRHMPKKVDFFFSGGQAMPASEGYLNTVGAT